MNNIEKAARLMGRKYSAEKQSTYLFDRDLGDYVLTPFNPITNKADLMDVETELCIDIEWFETEVRSCWRLPCGQLSFVEEIISFHPTKFAARAEAVMSVVSQLYDAKYGKDGE